MDNFVTSISELLARLIVLFTAITVHELAHGFVALTDEVEILYKASGEYAPQADRGIIWNDKDINIDWNIDFEPLLSEKDKVQPRLCEINLEELK